MVWTRATAGTPPRAKRTPLYAWPLPRVGTQWSPSPPIADEEERTLLRSRRSAKEAGLSVKYCSVSWQMSTFWQLSSIWFSYDAGTGPIGMFLPIGLYGVYMAVFSLSVWSMYRDSKRFSGVCWVVVITFVAVTLYIIATVMYYGMRIRYAHEVPMPLLRFGFIAIAWRNMSPCVCCSLSDSVLAWRCYVIFGKRRWLKWTLTIVVLVITSSGICSGILDLLENWGAYDGKPNGTVIDLALAAKIPTTLAWAVCSLVLNTVLSTSIIAKIVIVSRQTSRNFASSHSIPLARAFIESSLMSWIALTVYTGLYATANSTLSPNSVLVIQGQSVLNAILPLIFSISQALVIARLGVSRFAASTSFKDIMVALTSDDHDESVPISRAVAHRDVELCSNQE